MQKYFHTQILLYTVMPIKNEKKKIHSFMEAYRAIHLQLLLNLYIVILCIVYSTYKLLCRFIHPNILHCIEVSLHNLFHFLLSAISTYQNMLLKVIILK